MGDSNLIRVSRLCLVGRLAIARSDLDNKNLPRACLTKFSTTGYCQSIHLKSSLFLRACLVELLGQVLLSIVWSGYWVWFWFLSWQLRVCNVNRIWLGAGSSNHVDTSWGQRSVYEKFVANSTYARACQLLMPAVGWCAHSPSMASASLPPSAHALHRTEL